MAIVLNGTTGITTPDITSSGSLNIDASAPDNSLVVTSAGNVGIGTSSPRDVAGYVSLGLNDTTGGLLDFYANGTRVGGIVGVSGSLQIGTATATPLIFNTDTNERARIDSSGRTLIGITASRPNGGVLQVSAQGQTGLVTYTTSTASNNAAYFENGNGIVGTIATNGSSTSYNTSSDYRLKEDWVAVADASTRVNALKPVNFAWIASGERVDGFLAHELAEVVPEAVTGEKDAVDDEGNPVYQGIDQSKLVPLLTAALQEALAKIDDLTARVSALEAV
jgi:hypothetical protein